MYHLIMNAVMLAVLVTHLVHPVHLPLILAQPALIMNVAMLARLVLIVVQVVIHQPTPAVVMIPRRLNAALHVIGLKLVVLIAVRPGQNIIPVLMPAEQNVAPAAIIALILVHLVQPHLLVQVVTMLKVSVQQNVALLAILV